MKRRSPVGMLVAVVLAAGCQSDVPSSAPTKLRQPVARHAAKQRLFTATISDPKTFNPIIAADSASADAIGEVFDTLVRLDPRTLEVEPSLAERWECNTDGTECIFLLRHDARWHNGEPLTATDVVFTFDAIYDDRVPNSFVYNLMIDGQRVQVEALDDHAVRFRLPRPFAPLLNSIGVPIVPQRLLGESLEAGEFAQQWGVDTPPEDLIGSGPFRMHEYVPAEYIKLRRNPHYWRRDEAGRRLPYLEERTIRIVPNKDSAYRQFVAGETQIYNARPQEILGLQARQEELDITVREIGLDTGALFLTFNRNPAHYTKNGKRDPRLSWFTDKRFLRAIAQGIDRESIIDNTLQGFGRPAAAYISPANALFHNPHLDSYPYDLTVARQILTEAGYEDRNGDEVIEDPQGNPIEFDLHTNAGNDVRHRMCLILVEDLAKLGMKVNYRPLDFAVIVDKLDTTYEWDAMLMGFTGSVDPHHAAELLRSSGKLHVWHANQPQPATEWEAEIDRLLDAGSRELDLEKRRRIYWRIQEILHAELPMIPMVHYKAFTAYSNALRDFHPTAWGVYRPEHIGFVK